MSVNACSGQLRGWLYNTRVQLALAIADVVVALGLLLMIRQVKLAWNGISKKHRIIVASVAIAIWLVAAFVWNHGKPDQDTNDFLVVFSTFCALVLWGLYRLLSRILDAIWEHFANR